MPGITHRARVDSYPQVPDAAPDDLQRYFAYCDREAEDPSRVLSLFLHGQNDSHGMIARGITVSRQGMARCGGCYKTAYCLGIAPYPLMCPACLVDGLRDGGARKLYVGGGWRPDAALSDEREDADVADWETQVDRALAGGDGE